MLDSIKPLLDSGIINEETRTAIEQAWAGKLTEAREQIRTEVREEFAQRYDHDRAAMVEALDRMVTEGLKTELAEFSRDQRALAQDRVKFQGQMQESLKKFDKFMVSALAEEIQELRQERATQQKTIGKLERFVVEHLAEEIKEFATDKQAVVEARVKLVSEGRKELTALKARMIREGAERINKAVTSNLKTELNQLKEDINAARENLFGRRIFEAFANEFAVTHLNENNEIRKLQSKLEESQKALTESQSQLTSVKKLAESQERKVRVIQESVNRQNVINELCSTLNRDKSRVMRELLEGVDTTKLKASFDRYLPAVLGDKSQQPAAERQALTEGRREVTGDKTASVAEAGENNIIDIKRLAGLK
jgi:hypothetical protein